MNANEHELKHYSCLFAEIRGYVCLDPLKMGQISVISGKVLSEPNLHVSAFGQVNAFHKTYFAAVACHHNR
jgi:hypothetical protein